MRGPSRAAIRSRPIFEQKGGQRVRGEGDGRGRRKDGACRDVARAPAAAVDAATCEQTMALGPPDRPTSRAPAWANVPRRTECRLLDVLQKCEDALLEQFRGALVVVGQAVVSEQVSIAGV